MDPLNRIRELLEDWKHLTRRDGVKSALPIIGLEISQLPYRHLRFIILARSLTELLPQFPPRVALDIFPFQQPHLELVRAIHRPSEEHLCKKRLTRGQFGLIAYHQERPAGYAWACHPIDWDLERVRFHLEPDDILCTDVYTAPELRGKGVQTALTEARLQEFRDQGFRRAICYIEVNNQPSLAVWKRKFNARIVGKIEFLRIGSWYRVSST